MLDRQTGQPVLDRNGQKKMIQGTDLEHFRIQAADVLRGVDFDGRRVDPPHDMASLLEARAAEVYGPTPTSLGILFLSPNVKDVYRFGNTAWAKPQAGGKGFLTRACDGQVVTQEMIRQDGKSRMVFNPMDSNGCPKRCACLDEEGRVVHQECPVGCKARAELTVVLPDLGIPRQFNLRTGGLNDIRGLMKDLRAHDGRLNAGLFRLVRFHKEVNHVTEDGGTVKVGKWICRIELPLQGGMQYLTAGVSQNFAQLTGKPTHQIEAVWEDVEPLDTAFMIEPGNGAVEAPNGAASSTPAQPKPKQSRPVQAPPEPTQPAHVDALAEAQRRASEVATLRQAAGIEAGQVKAMIAACPNRSSGQPATHPSHLSQPDYEALLLKLQAPPAEEPLVEEPLVEEPLEASWSDI
jgi:hypothetical protein